MLQPMKDIKAQKQLDAYLLEVVPELTAKYKGTPQYPASYGFGNDFPIGVVKQ